MTPLIELRDVIKSYHDSTVLDIPHLKIKRGGAYGIMGANGAGKTTLLSIAAFILPPSSGTIYWEGVDSNTVDNHQLRKKVTLITQNPYLFHTTVEKNVAYGLRMRRIPLQ